MTTIELKRELINKITKIDDITFLKAIKTILDLKTKREIISLSAEQKDEIIESMNEIDLGLFTKHEQLDKEIMEWIDLQ